MGNFVADLQREKTFRPLAIEFYKQVMPPGTEIEYQENKDVQLSGVDVILRNGNSEVRVEEKYDTVAHKYKNVFLETWSDYNNTIGWIKKDLKCDFIYYFVLNSNQTAIQDIVVMPWKELKLYYSGYGEQWKEMYGTGSHQNWKNGKKSNLSVGIKFPIRVAKNLFHKNKPDYDNDTR